MLGCYPSSLTGLGVWRRVHRERVPPQLEVTICDFKIANSVLLSWNMKSLGKRSRFRRTAWFSTLTGTP